jgi:hypothetical protein
MRRALAETYPAAIRERGGKSNLSANFLRGLAGIDAGALDRPSAVTRYLNVDAVRQALIRLTSRPSEADALSVWKGLTLAQWFQHVKLTT